METNLLEEVLACLDDGRRLIHYYKDKYALFLLDTALSDQKSVNISNIRNSHLAKLLQKQLVKQLTAQCGDGIITKQKLSEFYVEHYESFVVTLSQWGCKQDYSWAQVSRPGKNLVVQLNFTGEHDQFMNNLQIDPNTFKYMSHPIHQSKSSVAWARIDFDFQTGEVLIEEIQNDWLRKATNHFNWSKRYLAQGKQYYYYYGDKYNANKMLNYTENTLKRYSKTWSETMLFTAIQFIKEELGIKKIYYHTVETAKVLKDLNYSFPPVSLYTDLPKKFCFRETNTGPEFILNERLVKRRVKKIRQAKWYFLEV